MKEPKTKTLLDERVEILATISSSILLSSEIKDKDLLLDSVTKIKQAFVFYHMGAVEMIDDFSSLVEDLDDEELQQEIDQLNDQKKTLEEKIQLINTINISISPTYSNLNNEFKKINEAFLYDLNPTVPLQALEDIKNFCDTYTVAGIRIYSDIFLKISPDLTRDDLDKAYSKAILKDYSSNYGGELKDIISTYSDVADKNKDAIAKEIEKHLDVLGKDKIKAILDSNEKELQISTLEKVCDWFQSVWRSIMKKCGHEYGPSMKQAKEFVKKPDFTTFVEKQAAIKAKAATKTPEIK